MIFPPLEARADLYRRLLAETLLVRSQTPTGERGHSFVYAATNAVVRDRVDDEDIYREACAFRDQMRACLGLPGPASIVPVNGSAAVVRSAVRTMWETGRYKTILFEGYVADSAREHAALFETIDAEFSAKGAIVLRANGAVADRWNDKSRFTAFMRSVHGVEATPPGVTVPVSPLDSVVELTRRQLSASGRAILKVAGMGGLGNLIVSSDQAGTIEQAIAAFLSQRPHATDVLVESWQPWRRTLGCSFFITETGASVPLEVCAQTVSKASGGFLGGTSVTHLSLGDRLALQAQAAPFVERVAADGMRGFLGVDVILSDAGDRPGELRLPDCGLATRFVEANMRVNAQNQDRLFVAQLAARHGRDQDLIDHAKVGVLLEVAQSRSEAVAMIDDALAGCSQPLSATFDRRRLHHVVIECYGGQRSSRNDFVMLVGEDVGASDFADAAGRLRAHGWVKE